LPDPSTAWERRTHSSMKRSQVRVLPGVLYTPYDGAAGRAELVAELREGG
jgi:hypothetical protein